MVRFDTVIKYENVLSDLEHKKKQIRKLSLFLEKLIQLIGTINQKIAQAEFNISLEIQTLCKKRDILYTRTDVTYGQVALELAELEKTMADRNNVHSATMNNLEGQRLELQKEYFAKCKRMETTMEAMKAQHDAAVAELKEQMLGASPIEIKEIQEKVNELERVFEMDLGNLKRLQQQFWKNIDIEEKAAVDNPNLCITPSGNFLTSSGRRLSWSEVSCAHRKQSELLDESSSNTSASSSSLSSASRVSSEDVQYLKTIFGKPLTLALVEITAKQPKDPIHYLGHWLFKYRYNQEVDMVKKRELEELMNERDRLEKEKLDILLQSEAKNVLVNLIERAEEEAIRNELERIARETAAIETEE